MRMAHCDYGITVALDVIERDTRDKALYLYYMKHQMTMKHHEAEIGNLIYGFRIIESAESTNL